MSQFILGLGVGVALSFAYHLRGCTFAQWLYSMNAYSDLTKVSRTLYRLDYKHKGEQYRIYIPIKTGPKSVVAVMDKADRDVYDQIHPYLGPNHDFHRHPVTPKELGFDKLSFLCGDGEVYSFCENEVINLP